MDRSSQVTWDSPVVIAAAPRSGTTIMVRALNQHPDLAITNEANILQLLRLEQNFVGVPANKLYEDGEYRFRGVVNPTYLDRLAAVHLDRSKGMIRDFYLGEFDKNFTRWGDKLVFGAQVLRDVMAVFPGMQFVHMVRDPRDAILSNMHHSAVTARRNEHGIAHEFEELCHFWLGMESDIRNVATVGNSILLRYEDLMAQPRVEMGTVQSFLGLNACEAVVAEFEQPDEASFKHHATSRSKSASLGRWRQELDTKQVELVENLCGELMRDYGYPFANEE